MSIIRFPWTGGFRGYIGSHSLALLLRPVELLVFLADLTGIFPQPTKTFTSELSVESVSLLAVGYDYGGD
jgi:hypothetical protein